MEEFRHCLKDTFREYSGENLDENDVLTYEMIFVFLKSVLDIVENDYKLTEDRNKFIQASEIFKAINLIKICSNK